MEHARPVRTLRVFPIHCRTWARLRRSNYIGGGDLSRSRRACKGKPVHYCLTRLTSRNAAVHLHQHGGGTWKGEEPRQAVGRGWNAGGGGAVAAVDGRLSTAGDQKTQRLARLISWAPQGSLSHGNHSCRAAPRCWLMSPTWSNHLSPFNNTLLNCVFYLKKPKHYFLKQYGKRIVDNLIQTDTSDLILLQRVEILSAKAPTESSLLPKRT